MNPFRYSVSLRLAHPTLPAAGITEALELEPIRAWDAGAPRTGPAGTALEGRNQSTYWTCRLSEGQADPNHSFTAALTAAVEQLERRHDFLRGFTASGGTVSLFIGWFANENIGVTLPPPLLERIAKLEAALELDIYP